MARNEAARRALSVIVAVVALIVVAPICFLIAIAIRLTSPGPVLYSQLRVGLDSRRGRGGPDRERRRCDLGGRPFMMHKFRTMIVDAERATGPVWAGRDDPRVTPVGKFLRETRLDELPQLVNVIAGDMNVVGPRPERPSIFAELRTEIPRYADRQRVRPGITGYAQVNFDADSTVSDVTRKLRYDLEYIDRSSFWTDLWIMLCTVPVLLFRREVLVPGHNGVGPTATPPPRRAAALATAHVTALELELELELDVAEGSYDPDDPSLLGHVPEFPELLEPPPSYQIARAAPLRDQQANV